MDVDSVDLAVAALERFVDFVDSLTPEELEAIAALGAEVSDAESEAEGFGMLRFSPSTSEASIEFIIGLAGKLTLDDNRQQV